MALTSKQSQFVVEYLIDRNAAGAAVRAGYSARTAHVIGPENLAKPDIINAIAEAEYQGRQRARVSADDVSDMWREAATCDRNDLMEVRRPCCRYCWSPDFTYQRTPAEFRAQADAHAQLLKVTPEREWAKLPPAPERGVTFDRRKDPNPDCPECWGDGDMIVVIKDTRKLPKGARQLYEGVKLTKDGVELKVMDRAKAIESLAKHLGMFVDRKVVMNPDGSAVDMRPINVNIIAVKAGGG